MGKNISSIFCIATWQN